jgi:hypothetical protein
MSTLWTFGDSMTFGYGCNDECHSNIKEDYLLYKKEGDNIWPNHLGKLLNYKVNNFGKNGASNDYIFDSIIENFDLIKENDIVIINMTLFGRIDVPIGDTTYNVYDVLSSYEGAKNLIGNTNNSKDKEIVETIINFQYYFSNHIFYKNRHKKRFEFIKKRLLNEKKIKFIYLWSLEEDNGIYASFETIYKATNGIINDTHFSFNGNLNFAHFLYGLMDTKKII